MSNLLQDISQIEHVIDKVLPTMLAAETVLLDIDGHKLRVQTPHIIESFASSIYDQCCVRLDALEAEADKRSAELCHFNLVDTEGVAL